MNERVNTSDWDDNVGGVFHGSCWCEVSLLLSFAELPGVYARSDLRKVWCLDHVEAEWRGTDLVLHNPTPWPARVNVWVEDETSASHPLPVLCLPPCRNVQLAPGGTVSLQETDVRVESCGQT